METIGIYEARTRWSEIIDKVGKGDEVTVTRHGVPIARIIPVDSEKRLAVRDAIAAMKEFGRGKSLRGLSLKKMIKEGRM
jgi:prevent-host-death family protein